MAIREEKMPRTHHSEHGSSRRKRRRVVADDYLASLHPWAQKLNVRRMGGITLAEILSGKTCSPISLPDFELYLVYREVSIEQLQFIVWFNDYRQRVGNPGMIRNASISSISSAANSLHSKRPAWSIPVVSDAIPISPLPPLSKVDSTFNDVELRKECMHVISTFLVPGSPKELLLEADLRERLIKGLETSCHPDLFLPVYKEVYFSLENDTLPRFLAYSLPNINLPKQVLWYITGILFFITSVAIAALMIAFIPPPRLNRAWRLFSVPIFHMGVTAIYASFQGFCSQVFARDAVQLHTWELRQVDEEAEAYVGRVRSAMREVPMGLVFNSADGSYSGEVKAISGAPPRREQGAVALVRPPMFGPERVVQDPHVLRAHRQIMNGILSVGFVSDILFSAIIFSIPGRST
ncbi:hypothetical protein CPB85DRAFT_1309907 [Mucidula mucida]|nr:hypothetical protein CPB85DRAFT_1309907 [Mucidula mucida]